MSSHHGTLEDQLREYEEQLRGLNSYVKELKAKAAEHDTPDEHVESDLREAEHNITYYEGEIDRIKGLIANDADTTYIVFQDASREWRWHLRAANRRIIADSSEGYRDKQDCLHAIALVKDSKDAPIREKR